MNDRNPTFTVKQERGGHKQERGGHNQEAAAKVIHVSTCALRRASWVTRKSRSMRSMACSSCWFSRPISQLCDGNSIFHLFRVFGRFITMTSTAGSHIRGKCSLGAPVYQFPDRNSERTSTARGCNQVNFTSESRVGVSICIDIPLT